MGGRGAEGRAARWGGGGVGGGGGRGSMIRVEGAGGFLRLAGSAALAGERWLRLAWGGLSRPGLYWLVTAAMTRSAARSSLSGRRGGKGARAADRAAHHVQRIDEGDPQRVLTGQRCGRADQLADRVVGAQQRPDFLLGPLGGLGPQHDPGAFHLGLVRADRGLDLPAGGVA